MNFDEAKKILDGTAASKGIGLKDAGKWLLKSNKKKWIKWLTLGLGAGGLFTLFTTTKSVSETDTMLAWFAADNVIGSQGIFFRDVAQRVESGIADPVEMLEIMQDRKSARDIAIAKVKQTARWNALAAPSKDLLLAGVEDQNKQIEFYENIVRQIVLSGEQPETIDESVTRRGEESSQRIDEGARARSEDFLTSQRERDAERDAHFASIREEDQGRSEENRRSNLGFGLLG